VDDGFAHKKYLLVFMIKKLLVRKNDDFFHSNNTNGKNYIHDDVSDQFMALNYHS
jgi:hypothetical protein